MKNELLQVRLTKLEKSIIKNKAELLHMTITDYVRECCIFNNATAIFINKLHETDKIKKL